MSSGRRGVATGRFDAAPASAGRGDAPRFASPACASRVTRRRALVRLASLVGAVGTAVLAGHDILAQAEEGRVIPIEVRRFQFTPSDIVLRRGESVTLAFKSLDFVHGFNAPDFGIRADLLPGQITRVRLQPDRLGRFGFLCDNFCGDGHEQMGGLLIVEA